MVAALFKDTYIIHTPLHVFHTYLEAAGVTVALHVAGFPALLHPHSHDSPHVSMYTNELFGEYVDV